MTQHHDFLFFKGKKLFVIPRVGVNSTGKSQYVLGNVVTGSTDSICALSSLLGRVPLFNDGVTSWHAFNRSEEEDHQLRAN